MGSGWLQTRLADDLSGGEGGLRAAVRSVRQSTGVDRVCLNVFRDDTFETVAANGGRLLDVGTRLPLAASSHLSAAARRERLETDDLDSTGGTALPVDQLVKMHGFRSATVTPIAVESQVLGALVLTTRGRDANPDLLPRMESVSGMFALAISGALKAAAPARIGIVADDLVVGEGIARIVERKMQASAITATPAAGSDWPGGFEVTDLVLAPVYFAGRRIEEVAAGMRDAGVTAPIVTYDIYGTSVGYAAAMAAGARAYFGPDDLKSSSRLTRGIRSVLDGTYRAPSLLDHDLPPRLTPRETEVLADLCSGGQVKEIAAAIGIATTTTRGYVQAVYRKLDVHSRAEAISEATRQGLLGGIQKV